MTKQLSTIKAIETVYAGHRFRSRLEARWAVFFDTLGVRWQYEVQGYAADDGSRYLPDFYLPDDDAWCEVKGDSSSFAAEHSRMASVLKPGGPLPLVLLGEIPRPAQDVVAHPTLIHVEELNLCRSYAVWVPFRDDGTVRLCLKPFQTRPSGQLFEDIMGWPAYVHLEKSFSQKEWDTPPIRSRAGGSYFPRVSEAYAVARSARFEHGEGQ